MLNEEAVNSLDNILKIRSVDRHSLFQLQCFVLGKEPTLQGKLWQCVRELRSRKASLDAAELEIEHQKDNLELLDIDKDRLIMDEIMHTREKAIRLRQIDRKKKQVQNQIVQLESKRKDIEEEVLFFIQAFVKLHEIEPLKNWDDPDVQKQYWNAKLEQELKLRLYLRQAPDLEVVKTILALNEDAPVKGKLLEVFKSLSVANSLPTVTQETA